MRGCQRRRLNPPPAKAQRHEAAGRLQRWAGVAHTQTLSLRVLGLTHTSAGRHEEADAALLRALALAREPASAGFEAEALVRRARLLLQCGRAEQAQTLAARLGLVDLGQRVSA